MIRPVRRGDVYLLPEASAVYYTRTDAQLSALYEDDHRRGDTMDSAGEPRVYSRQGVMTFDEPTTVLITSLRGVPWHAFSRRPPGLVQGVVTSGRWLGTMVVLKKVWLDWDGEEQRRLLEERRVKLVGSVQSSSQK